jgi:hypothetical protein
MRKAILFVDRRLDGDGCGGGGEGYAGGNPGYEKLTYICPTCALKGCYLFCSRFQGPLDPISSLKSLAWFIYNEYGNTAALEHL